MSTITSPRASPRVSTSVRSPSSTRASFELPTRTPAAPQRRNRAALRDYYGLKGASDKGAEKEAPPSRDEPVEEPEALAELDNVQFNADEFVNSLLAKEGLEGVLKVEADLVSQIRNLDSDRKSLVYDNYSKLIAATDTIRKMRTNMDPLAPTTHTLSPAISHIAETAASLSASMHERPGKAKTEVRVEVNDGKNKERDTVKWVLDTPRRLREMLDDDREEEAEREWEDVKRILKKWEGVGGVKELWEECEDIFESEDSS